MSNRSSVKIKICGIKTLEALQAAVQGGAHMIGFVFVPQSPRYIPPAQAAHLVRQLPATVKAVGLFASPTDADLEAALGATTLDMIQLHGDESPARVQAIKDTWHMPVIKALPVSTAKDIEAARAYEPCADWLLFDAKPPKGAQITGGHGQVFDWRLLDGQTFAKPWMLSGGLTPDNVRGALDIISPNGVDVSSGVESTRGVKDLDKIAAFTAAVKAKNG